MRFDLDNANQNAIEKETPIGLAGSPYADHLPSPISTLKLTQDVIDEIKDGSLDEVGEPGFARRCRRLRLPFREFPDRSQLAILPEKVTREGLGVDPGPECALEGGKTSHRAQRSHLEPSRHSTIRHLGRIELGRRRPLVPRRGRVLGRLVHRHGEVPDHLTSIRDRQSSRLLLLLIIRHVEAWAS